MPIAVMAVSFDQRVAQAAQEPSMRVLLSQAPVVRLRADGQQPLQVRGLGGGNQRMRAIEVRLRAGRLKIRGQMSDGSSRSLSARSAIEVQSDDPRGIWLGSRRYRGRLQFLVRRGQVQVVNHLGVETYLASVVGSEMPHRWPLPALQAQAVAARTYALRQLGKAGDFDVKASVSSQVYRGVESETPSTIEAVQSTRSLVLVHAGRMINAVFHSSSGGATEPSGEVWRNQLPYLVSVADHDQHSPAHRWNKRFDDDALRELFRETGGVKRLQVLKTSSTGRVRTARVQGPRGSLVLTGRELRQRLGLKSTMVQFELINGSTESLIASAETAHQAAPPLIGLWQDSASAPDTSSSTSGRLASLLPPPPLPPLNPSAFNQPRPHLRVGEIVLEARGQGFGHGVGMSQWGAHGLALQGADFRQILLHYYRGAEIRPYRSSDDPTVALRLRSESAWWG
ncbi:MAG: SpoIID/LytB domain-containing protein [Synechococcus sp.]|uniref:SpoIID/LytB domain-containing protein n=1 Tax=Synechococcus sp. PROS-9-1 TaxID=1968775 RepID=UPI000E013CBC|nr:SpoIID/LytB domain-containing protein [Synechococcus sp. PROS-9-1]QNJ32547.1 stage II sporulation protein D [Synechococcus sp. PROS-9-1]RCL59399.1 MAG: SpoIID/LytB domain-containing protein [Synechococcus sp. MED-G68]